MSTRVSKNYITQCQSWSSSCSSRQWEPARGRVLGPSGPRLSSPAEWERSAAKDRGTWGQYVTVCSVSNSPLTHNPFATISNKVWEVYFSKELCSFVIIVDYVSACICIRIVVSRPYTIYIYIYIYIWNFKWRILAFVICDVINMRYTCHKSSQ